MTDFKRHLVQAGSGIYRAGDWSFVDNGDLGWDINYQGQFLTDAATLNKAIAWAKAYWRKVEKSDKREYALSKARSETLIQTGTYTCDHSIIKNRPMRLLWTICGPAGMSRITRKDGNMNLWDEEPDHVEFRHTGFPCILHRNDFGAWCGYVGVPPGHSAYGRDMGSTADLEVHGGVTYSSECRGPICHTPEPGEPDNVWWLGFDCNHCYDLMPYPWTKEHHEKYIDQCGEWPKLHREGVTYRTFEYVKSETENLAEQLSRLAAAGQVC